MVGLALAGRAVAAVAVAAALAAGRLAERASAANSENQTGDAPEKSRRRPMAGVFSRKFFP